MRIKTVDEYKSLNKKERETYIRKKLGYKDDDDLIAIYTHEDELSQSKRGTYFFTNLINKYNDEKLPIGKEILSDVSGNNEEKPLEIYYGNENEKYAFKKDSNYLVEFTLSDAEDFFQYGRLLNYNSLRHEISKDYKKFLSEVKYELENIGYYYNERTIRRVMLSLITGEMTLLVGPSGTGKTSLVSNLAKILGAECEIISVQPNWQDKQDLLGFYNPMRREYFATSFIDTLIEANKEENKDKLYFICLDEINLAKVEYYFAEVLSTMELENPMIRLYSDSEYNKNKKRAKKIREEFDDDLRNFNLKQFDLQQQVANHERYKSQLPIPENVRIFGTMNTEGLIEPLSPKIIDRSIIIPLDNEATTPYQEKRCNDYIPFEIKTSYFTKIKGQTIDKSILDTFNRQLSTVLNDLELPYHYRFKNQAENYFKIGYTCGIEKEELLDDIILMKALPRIHSSGENMIGINWNQDEYKELEFSASKYNQMLETTEHTRIFSYWIN